MDEHCAKAMKGRRCEAYIVSRGVEQMKLSNSSSVAAVVAVILTLLSNSIDN